MPTMASIPQVTKASLGFTLLTTILNLVVSYRVTIAQETEGSTEQVLVLPFLVLVPAVWYKYIWTFATTSFVQPNIVMVRRL